MDLRDKSKLFAFLFSILFCPTSVFAQRLTRAPELVQFVEAEYPSSERSSGRAATVVLSITISSTGTVEQATVTESAGEAFDQAALLAVRSFTFRPAEVDGHPSRIRILYRYQFTMRVEAPTTAIFEGRVTNRTTHQPIVNAVVEVNGAGRATTDNQGRFHIENVPAGSHAISLSGGGLTPVQTNETFIAGQRLQANYDVSIPEPASNEPSDDLELVVVAPQITRQAVSTEVSADQARRVAGTQGDVLRVVENLPGVARSSTGSGQLIVWGASPQDTRVLIDGVPVPRLYHDGGLRSVLPSEFVQNVELTPGGYGSAYGRGLGGLVSVTTRALNETGVHGNVGVDLYDLSGSIRADLGGGVHASVGVRRSHLDSLLSLGSVNIGSYFPIPHYYDVQARISYEPSPRERLEFTGIFSSDQISRGNASPDPASVVRENRQLDFFRFYGRYIARTNDAIITIVPYLGTDHRFASNRVGSVTTDLNISSAVFGLRASWRGRIAPWLTAEAGFDGELTSSGITRNGALAAPAREGDVRVFGQPFPDQIATDQWSTVQLGIAPYTELDFGILNDTLHIVPGLRLDPYIRSVSRKSPNEGQTPTVGLFAQNFQVEPRLNIRWTPHRRVTIRAGYGYYSQFPQLEDLSAVFGTPSLPISHAHHVLLGAGVSITTSLSVEATGFASFSYDLAVRNPVSAPLRAQALVSNGLGRSYGVQLLLRQEAFHGFFGWISYTLMRSERSSGIDQPYRLFDFDQTHVFTALAGYQLPYGFEVGIRFRIASGMPRTAVTSSYYDALRDRYQPVFGDQNADRIPLFFQLDARVSKKFRISTTELEIFLDVQNVTNQSNPEEIVYSQDFSQRGYISGLPILPTAGARWVF